VDLPGDHGSQAEKIQRGYQSPATTAARSFSCLYGTEEANDTRPTRSLSREEPLPLMPKVSGTTMLSACATAAYSRPKLDIQISREEISLEEDER